jgi:hypothetical protein
MIFGKDFFHIPADPFFIIDNHDFCCWIHIAASFAGLGCEAFGFILE